MRAVVVLLLAAVRAVVGVACVVSGQSFAVAFGVVELVAVVLGLWNLRSARAIDVRPVGWAIPAIYLSGALLRIEGGGGVVPGVAAWCCVAWLLACRLHLLSGWSIGHASFVRLVDWGLYGVVRHPGWLGLVGLRLAWLAAVPSTWNVGVVLLSSALFAVGCLIEEGFLRERPEYLRYCARVRWRFVPGIA